MDRPMDKEFTYVHVNSGGNELSEELVISLMNINQHGDCRVTEYEGTITINCCGLAGFGDLISICTRFEDEGPNLQFYAAIQRAIVKFIGN